MKWLIDSRGRRISYLRISVTSNCNLKCAYCSFGAAAHVMVREDHLSMCEIIRVARCAAKLGIKSIRITGGEPLMRSDIVDLVGEVSKVEGVEDLSMTTNGVFLLHHADALRRAGLKRVNISLDSLSDEKLKVMTGASLGRILSGIDAALCVGFDCVKLNCVVMRHFNLDEVDRIALLSVDKPLHVRFIEYQPIGCDRGLFAANFVSASEVWRNLSQAFELEPVDDKAKPPGFGPAKYWRINGALGTIGFIAPVSEPFCNSCNRLRLTCNGILRSCLAYEMGVDLRRALKGDDAEIENAFVIAASLKPFGHNYSCVTDGTCDHVEVSLRMREIGG